VIRYRAVPGADHLGINLPDCCSSASGAVDRSPPARPAAYDKKVALVLQGADAELVS